MWICPILTRRRSFRYPYCLYNHICNYTKSQKIVYGLSPTLKSATFLSLNINFIVLLKTDSVNCCWREFNIQSTALRFIKRVNLAICTAFSQSLYK